MQIQEVMEREVISLCAAQASDDDLIELRRQVAASMDDPRFVAIGEIGLDFFIPDPQVERQNAVYQAQLKIAREFDLPVLLHVRKSQDQVRSAAARAGVRRGIAHAFNGSDDQARHYVDTGFKLGFGGVFTFSRANRLQRLAAQMPLEAIVLETDAPDLAPAWLADDQFSEQVGTRNALATTVSISSIRITPSSNRAAALPPCPTSRGAPVPRGSCWTPRAWSSR